MRSRSALVVLSLVLVAVFGVATSGFAYDAMQINARVEAGLQEFDKVVTNSEEVMDAAAGVLVCPKISKVGLGIGVSKGNCALMIDGQTAEYWRTSSASIGLTAGIQSTGTVVAFMTPDSLEKFRKSDRGWEAGVDGSIAVAKVGAAGTMSTAEMKDPIVGWIYSTKGLMADLSFAGSTYKRIGTEEDVAKYEDPFHRFVATADVEGGGTSRGGAQTVQMTIDIDDWVTIAQIEAMQRTIREGGADAAHTSLAEMPAVGTVKQGGQVIPIQWARALQMGQNYRVLLATSEPMGFSWAQNQGSPTVFQLDLAADRLGSGVMQMNPELGWDDNRGGITVQQKNIRPIPLSSVSYRKIE